MTILPKLLAGTCALALIGTWQPAAAAEVSKTDASTEVVKASSDPAPITLDRTSRFCPVSMFSDGDDIVDLSGSTMPPCFDLAKGNDLLKLGRSDYPQGTKVYTGEGRDSVELTDHTDEVEDSDGRDAMIATFGGDDRITLKPSALGEDRQPLLETVVAPGTGYNQLLVGYKPGAPDRARRAQDIKVSLDAGSALKVEAGCGRFTDSQTYDIDVPNVPARTQLDAVVSGCGFALSGVEGSAGLQTEGGGLAISSDGDGRPSISSQTREGAGFLLDLSGSMNAPTIAWQGSGVASISLSGEIPYTGAASDLAPPAEADGNEAAPDWPEARPGVVSVSIDGDIAARIAGKGVKAGVDLSATKAIDIRLEDGARPEYLSLGALRVTIHWSPSLSDTEFPSIKLPASTPVYRISGQNISLSDTVDADLTRQKRIIQMQIDGNEKKLKSAKNTQQRASLETATASLQNRLDGLTAPYLSSAIKRYTWSKDPVEAHSARLVIEAGGEDAQECVSAWVNNRQVTGGTPIPLTKDDQIHVSVQSKAQSVPREGLTEIMLGDSDLAACQAAAVHAMK